VAIAKDGKLGLTRGTNTETSPSRSVPGSEMDVESSISHGGDVDELGQTPRRLFVNDNIPESPKTSVRTPISEDVGALTDNPSHNPDKFVDQEDAPAHLLSADAAEGSAPAHHSHMTEKGKGAGKTSEVKSSTVDEGTQDGTSRGTTISQKRTAKSSDTKQVKPATTNSNTKGTPKSLLGHAVKKPTVVGQKLATAASADQRHSREAVEASKMGLGRTQAKAPIKPDKVSAPTVAQATSSSSKHDNSRLLSSRQSAARQSPKISERSSSRMSVSKQVNGPANTIRRQASTISQARPSIGPPPKKAQGHQAPKIGNPVDQDFLARMMRPTQSSSSKTSEKAPVTPPRKKHGARLSPAARLAKPRVEGNTKSSALSSSGSVAGVAISQEASRSAIDPDSPTSGDEAGNNRVKFGEGLASHIGDAGETGLFAPGGASQDFPSKNHIHRGKIESEMVGEKLISIQDTGFFEEDSAGTTKPLSDPSWASSVDEISGDAIRGDQIVDLKTADPGDALPETSSQALEKSATTSQSAHPTDMTGELGYEPLAVHDESKDRAPASDGELLDSTQGSLHGALRSTPG
jgi:hypothetical protein